MWLFGAECFILLLFRISWNKIGRSFLRKWPQTIQSMSTMWQNRKVPGTHPSWIPAFVHIFWHLLWSHNCYYLITSLPLSIHETMIATLWPSPEWFYPKTWLLRYRNYQNYRPAQLLELQLIPLTIEWDRWHWLWHFQRDQSNCSRPMSCTSAQNISTSVLVLHIAVWPHTNSKILMQSEMDG